MIPAAEEGPVEVESELASASVGLEYAPAMMALALPLEVGLLDLVNADRAKGGLPLLEFDPALLEIARARAEAQLGSGPLSHHDAVGRLAFVDLLGAAGVDYLLAGENLARATLGTGVTLELVEQALMASPTHRKNILEPSFNRLAVGMATDGSGRTAFAQIFRAAP